jgi:hypothetical protein
VDYYALSVTLDSEGLPRYNKDRLLPLKSAGYLNFLSRFLLLGILLTSAVIRNRLLISDFKWFFLFPAIPLLELDRWLIFRRYHTVYYPRRLVIVEVCSEGTPSALGCRFGVAHPSFRTAISRAICGAFLRWPCYRQTAGFQALPRGGAESVFSAPKI